MDSCRNAGKSKALPVSSVGIKASAEVSEGKERRGEKEFSLFSSLLLPSFLHNSLWRKLYYPPVPGRILRPPSACSDIARRS
jgi:hypothetical protein